MKLGEITPMINGTDICIVNDDEIMKMIYNAMWDYNYHFKLNVTDELLSRKRAYLKGLIDMARCFIDKCTVIYESYSMNSKITDIIIDDMSVTEWHEKE